LRDYGITSSIWDGDPTCEHKFVNKVIKHNNLRFRCGSNTNVGNYKNPEIYSNHKVNNIFCSKCGAWRGQLGLEPDFELYIKHLINIFDERTEIYTQIWAYPNATASFSKNISSCKIPLSDTLSFCNCNGRQRLGITQRINLVEAKLHTIKCEGPLYRRFREGIFLCKEQEVLL